MNQKDIHPDIIELFKKSKKVNLSAFLQNYTHMKVCKYIPVSICAQMTVKSTCVVCYKKFFNLKTNEPKKELLLYMAEYNI
jgi:hypothetical protein